MRARQWGGETGKKGGKGREMGGKERRECVVEDEERASGLL